MKKTSARIRLDQLLVDQNLADSKSKAQAMIMAGEVYIGEEKQSKPGHKVAQDSPVQIKNIIPTYVSRGGLKLAGAIKDFSIQAKGLICLDVGASTGGFTDCLIQHGAQHVYCIDVGKNQLHYKLHQHPKISWRESLHVKDFLAEKTFSPVNLKHKVDLVVIDCSFIALEKVMPHIVDTLHAQSQVIALIKPQFQAQAKDLVKGVIKDQTLRQNLIVSCIDTIESSLPFRCTAKSDSHIKGPKGNQECFVLFEYQE
ncbi:MAG TPA: TlyA family RNA methyltransferase [Oligoflexia bacterium]|nr:TlyA family RNA methyltransferase [Oligoflexia bacterium]HMR24895.1 TlyA family RNA methyltransferase [Oligoflexia bacterium]